LRAARQGSDGEETIGGVHATESEEVVDMERGTTLGKVSRGSCEPIWVDRFDVETGIVKKPNVWQPTIQ